MIGHKEVARRFRNGESTSRGSNMSIEVDDDGFSVVWGFGHAVYAIREPNGDVHAFTSWSNRSQSSNRHMSLLNTRRADEIENERPESIEDAKQLLPITA